MDLIGKLLGNRYEIIEEIGIGGMATVYKARCKLLNRNVAVKILKDEFANDSEFIKRFQIEAQAAASLSHPNIVSIYDVGNENNLHYIVMELIEGETLKDIIRKMGRIDWKDAVDIASQIAAGLTKAHANHIVHRDIKPHNIIITKDGVAKVTDFGIAKAVSNSTINAFGSTVGSVHYFSPEHARGGYTDEKSDIYSLGVVLYEMVTGKLPFDADTPVSVALKHIQEIPKEPIEINNMIPIGVNNIIIKAMAKDISERYQTALEMYKDLERILKNPTDIPETVVAIRKNDEFPTQKIPIVGVENIHNNKKIVQEEKEEIGVKNGITKKQAVIKLIIILVIAISLFVAAVNLGNYVLTTLFSGANNAVVEVPDLLGAEQTEAKRRLEEKKLLMEVIGYVASDYPEGYVAKQSHPEGYKLKEGATVEVSISKGEKTVLVPGIKDLATAKVVVEQRGLVYALEERYSDSVPSGEIIEQIPRVNEEVSAGSIVTVYVSKGVELDSGLVTVPNTVGDSEEVATQKLSAANLIVEVTTVTDPSKKDGIVVSQSPVEGEIVTQLDEVVIAVNKLSNKEDNEGNNNSDSANNEQPNKQNGKISVPINLSNRGERETFVVKVVLQGTLVGTRVEYEGTHSRTDGTINVDVTNAPGSLLKVYIDGEFVSEQIL